MYLKFAWRYFRAKKSANAINIIAWVTTGVIAFATCCQILVLSVYNGLDELVKSLYTSFYTDLKVMPADGKTFRLDSNTVNRLRQLHGVNNLSWVAEEKALLQNREFQSVIQLKGVDDNFDKVSGVPEKIIQGSFETGTTDSPLVVVGYGVQNAAGILLSNELGEENMALILPRSNVNDSDPLQSLSEGVARPSGVFSLQQEFDNAYAFTNIGFVRQQTGMSSNEGTGLEISLKNPDETETTKKELEKILGPSFLVQDRYQQNSNLYRTLTTEKWVIYAVLTLILIIAAFNMVSALTMLVLEKKRDISILRSIGASDQQIGRIFLSEGLLLGVAGTLIGITLASAICYLQLRYRFLKLQGGSFIIDYFPVKFVWLDFLIVTGTALTIVLLASWIPARKASVRPFGLK